MRSKAYIPFNYRETPYRFGDHILMVAGLARPDCQSEPDSTFHYLKNQGISCIFGLDVCSSLISHGLSFGLSYYDVSIPDFTAPDISLYDLIYKKVLEEGARGNKVAVHCRAGIGRTGVVLAALKLKELAMDNSFYESLDLKQESVFLCHSLHSILVTPNVAKAIALVRIVPGSENAIETLVQVESLMLYEKYLKKIQFI